MDDDHLTKEWVNKRIEGENQFKIVNYLIKLAHQKVQRGQSDEFDETQNIALDVMHDVASGKIEGREVERDDQELFTEESSELSVDESE